MFRIVFAWNRRSRNVTSSMYVLSCSHVSESPLWLPNLISTYHPLLPSLSLLSAIALYYRRLVSHSATQKQIKLTFHVKSMHYRTLQGSLTLSKQILSSLTQHITNTFRSNVLHTENLRTYIRRICLSQMLTYEYSIFAFAFSNRAFRLTRLCVMYVYISQTYTCERNVRKASAFVGYGTHIVSRLVRMCFGCICVGCGRASTRSLVCEVRRAV